MNSSSVSHGLSSSSMLDELGKEEAAAMQELQGLRLRGDMPNASNDVSSMPIKDEGPLIVPPPLSPGNLLPPSTGEPPSASPPTASLPPEQHPAAASGGGESLSPLLGADGGATASEHPFETEPGDHAETPLDAYEHIAPLLTRLARRLDTTPALLRIYDPYYCEGRCGTIFLI